MHVLNICHLYPDVLNLYGDRGNIIALQKRALWRGIAVNLLNITQGDEFVPEEYDIVFLGGGQDSELEIIQQDLLKHKGNSIKRAIEQGKVFLCICGGYQLLGNFYKTWDGKEIECLGALNIWTIGGRKRLTGNLVFECNFLGNCRPRNLVVGFENHSGKTYLGPEVKPLGKLLMGNGNNGQDGYEGAVYKNVYCSYSHGSLLPKNPALTDHLLMLALKQKYGEFTELEPLDDKLEELAHNTTVKRLIKI